jgi:hypothetical protein
MSGFLKRVVADRVLDEEDLNFGPLGNLVRS